jgi:hypothetical protein
MLHPRGAGCDIAPYCCNAVILLDARLTRGLQSARFHFAETLSWVLVPVAVVADL